MQHCLSLLGRSFHTHSHYLTSSASQPVRPEDQCVKIAHFSYHIPFCLIFVQTPALNFITINLSTLCQFLVSLLIAFFKGYFIDRRSIWMDLVHFHAELHCWTDYIGRARLINFTEFPLQNTPYSIPVLYNQQLL